MAKFQIALGMFGLHNMFDGDARGYIKAAELADAAGIDLVCFTDHVVMGENTDRYPYGPFPLPPIAPWFEPLTMLTAIAVRTRQVRLATGVLISPLRPAVLLAKTDKVIFARVFPLFFLLLLPPSTFSLKNIPSLFYVLRNAEPIILLLKIALMDMTTLYIVQGGSSISRYLIFQ